MRIGSVRLHKRTLRGFYYAAGSFTLLVLGVGLCVLFGMMLLPEAREVTLR
jgi:hypothetical protein